MLKYSDLMLDAIERLAGHQVTDVDELHRLLVGGEPFGMPRDVHALLRKVLLELGYEARRVCSKEGGRPMMKYVRGPWPIDHRALRGSQVETFFAID